MASKYGVDLKITRLLLEIGVLAAGVQRFDEAQRLVSFVKAFRDDVPHPRSTLALTYMYQARYDDAIEELKATLASFPEHQLGKALLGFAYKQQNIDGWEQLLREVIADGRDRWAIECATATLGEEEEPAPPPPRQPEKVDFASMRSSRYA